MACESVLFCVALGIGKVSPPGKAVGVPAEAKVPSGLKMPADIENDFVVHFVRIFDRLKPVDLNMDMPKAIDIRPKTNRIGW